MDTNALKPSDFTKFPIASIFGAAEYEGVAQNIMIILTRTGDEWRQLLWKEYKKERKKDEATEHDLYREESYFEDVSTYCANAKKALEFCPHWITREYGNEKQ